MADLSELQYLVQLLDDNDNVVQECVRKRLSELGQPAVRALLPMASRETDENLRRLIQSAAFDLNAEIKTADFNALFNEKPSPVSLFEAAYLVCSMLDPTVSREPFEERFFRCSSEYMAESSDQRTAVENIRIFNHIFFHRLSFSLYDVDIQVPEYALVNEVVRTRKGNPFAIAFIYLMIAQVAGLPLQIMSFPGGFVPVYVEDGKELFYINVYRNGEIFLKDRLQEFLSALGLDIAQDSFQLRNEDALVTIYLESLQFVFSNNGDTDKCRIIDKALDCIGQDRFLVSDMDDEDA